MRNKYYLRTDYVTYCYFTRSHCNHIGNCSTCPEYIKRRNVASSNPKSAHILEGEVDVKGVCASGAGEEKTR